MNSNDNKPGWQPIEFEDSDFLDEASEPTVNPVSHRPAANPFVDDEKTDPGLLSPLSEEATDPGLLTPAAMRTGGFGAVNQPPGAAPIGAYSSPGFTPPTGPPNQPGGFPTGGYSSPGFTPPTGPPTTGGFDAVHGQPPHQPGGAPIGSYSSPGFTPPTGPPTPTGPYAAPNLTPAGGTPVTGSFSGVGQAEPGSAAYNAEHFSGQFTIPTGPMPGLEVPTSEPKSLRDKRISYGIWGAALGAVIGIVLGVVNALAEGVSIENGTTPLILFTFLGMFSLGGSAAYSPHVFEGAVKAIGLGDDDEG